MCVSIRFRVQKARSFIDGHIIYTSLHQAKQVVLKVRDDYPLVSHDMICHTHMGVEISVHTINSWVLR